VRQAFSLGVGGGNKAQSKIGVGVLLGSGEPEEGEEKWNEKNDGKAEAVRKTSAHDREMGPKGLRGDD